MFEIGLKGYMYGDEAVALAKAADRISKEHGIQIILDPQFVDIPAIARETERLLVFAQHMDPVTIGRGHGRILPEALKAAGAVGVVLNHAERKITPAEVGESIKRADEAGLATMVCADSPEEAADIARLGPNIILAEPPDLIGTGKSLGKEKKDFISRSMAAVKSINPDIVVFNSAGIRTADDVAEIIRLGAEATGSTSGIMKAEDPVATTDAMVAALKQAWEETR